MRKEYVHLHLVDELVLLVHKKREVEEHLLDLLHALLDALHFLPVNRTRLADSVLQLALHAGFDELVLHRGAYLLRINHTAEWHNGTGGGRVGGRSGLLEEGGLLVVLLKESFILALQLLIGGDGVHEGVRDGRVGLGVEAA